MFETDNVRCSSIANAHIPKVTAADVRLASIILMNEDPVLDEKATEQPDSAQPASQQAEATPLRQSLTLSTNEDLSI